MKQEEKNDKLQSLKERLEIARVRMTSSDGKAAKCAKKGISFAETYPEDFAEYIAANDEYNAIERNIAEIEAIEAEEATEEITPK